MYLSFTNILLKQCVLISVISILICSCATKVYVQNPSTFKGKKIGIGTIDVSLMKQKRGVSKDTICACIAQSAQQAFVPYLQQAGFKVIILPLYALPEKAAAGMLAATTQFDFILRGNGMINTVGSSTFMEQLNVNIISTDTREVVISGSFSGPSTGAIKAAGKIGKQMVKKVKEK